MIDTVFRAKMRRADRSFQRALASALAPVQPELPALPEAKKAIAPKLPVGQRLAMAKRLLKLGWDLDDAAFHTDFKRAELDLELWNSLGAGA
jgi:hypothetical protein